MCVRVRARVCLYILNGNGKGGQLIGSNNAHASQHIEILTQIKEGKAAE